MARAISNKHKYPTPFIKICCNTNIEVNNIQYPFEAALKIQILTDAKAFPSASPVCELPAALPLLPVPNRNKKNTCHFEHIQILLYINQKL